MLHRWRVDPEDQKDQIDRSDRIDRNGREALVCFPVKCGELAAAGSARAQGALSDEQCLYLRAVQRSERVEAAVESPQH